MGECEWPTNYGSKRLPRFACNDRKSHCYIAAATQKKVPTIIVGTFGLNVVSIGLVHAGHAAAHTAHATTHVGSGFLVFGHIGDNRLGGQKQTGD